MLGVKGGRGGKCDVRKGYQGNPDCKSGESCVPEILNLGECKTGNISWQKCYLAAFKPLNLIFIIIGTISLSANYF